VEVVIICSAELAVSRFSAGRARITQIPLDDHASIFTKGDGGTLLPARPRRGLREGPDLAQGAQLHIRRRGIGSILLLIQFPVAATAAGGGTVGERSNPGSGHLRVSIDEETKNKDNERERKE
jgi:hypothetical protein